MANNRKQSDDHGRVPLATISGHHNQTQHDTAHHHETCDVQKFRKEHPFLSALFRKDGILFECDSQAPSPSKDYGQLQITMDKVSYMSKCSFSYLNISSIVGYSSLVENNTSKY